DHPADDADHLARAAPGRRAVGRWRPAAAGRWPARRSGVRVLAVAGGPVPGLGRLAVAGVAITGVAIAGVAAAGLAVTGAAVAGLSGRRGTGLLVAVAGDRGLPTGVWRPGRGRGWGLPHYGAP